MAESVLNMKYVDSNTGVERAPFADQKDWEDEKMRNALAKSAGAAASIKNKEYDMVFPEEMAETFVMAETIAGENQVAEISMSAQELKKRSMLECRQSLPVFAYRQAFLDAVREHQVYLAILN